MACSISRSVLDVGKGSDGDSQLVVNLLKEELKIDFPLVDDYPIEVAFSGRVPDGYFELLPRFLVKGKYLVPPDNMHKVPEHCSRNVVVFF